jgi:hypothetical protein
MIASRIATRSTTHGTPVKSIHTRSTAELDFGETGGTLDRAEYLFDAFPAALVDVIAGVTRGASVDRRLA